MSGDFPEASAVGGVPPFDPYLQRHASGFCHNRAGLQALQKAETVHIYTSRVMKPSDAKAVNKAATKLENAVNSSHF